MDAAQIRKVVDAALAEGRDALTELEGLAILEAMGVPTARRHFVRDSAEAAKKPLLPGPRAVVKVISPEILHKTEVGGVAIVPNENAAIADAIRAMEAKFAGQKVEGYTINEFVPFEPRLGHEIIVGYRFAPDFGPVVSFGPGGIYTEFLATVFKPGAANAFWSPAVSGRAEVERELRDNAVRTLLCGGLRGTRAALEERKLVDVVAAFVEASALFPALGILEFEVNPFAVAKGESGEGRLVALDALVKIGRLEGGELARVGDRIVNAAQAARPLGKIDRILEPRSAAVIGVSEKGMNNGRIILRNLIENGFDRKRLYVVKPGLDELDGCRCVTDVASLPEKVDLFVLVIPAAQAAATIAELAEADKAESVIVIPGGLEEKQGTEAIVARMKAALAKARAAGGGPLLNGGNCLGIRSVPGRYNTLFIPEHKLPMPKGEVAPIAVISQSGAFAICRVSKHPRVNPKYIITCGNQMDLTVGDYLERLAEDRELEIFAVYVEGFKPLDGEKTLRAVKRIVESGRSVIFYRAGRTAAGAAASASHTASIAGDWPVTRALMAQAGAVVVETLDDFDDALTTFALLRGKKATGRRLGALSNAGFECVAFADNLGSLELAAFGPATAPRLGKVFADSRISEIVDVHNPVDLTPMAPDAAYDDTFRAILDDPNVDCGLAGIVPLTGAMNTLAAGGGHAEDVTRGDSVAGRYGRIMRETDKPWIAVVDSGTLYDPLVAELESRGVPTFRTADRALRMLNLWLDARLRG
ncbi:MAG TPA: acetate--CoA ligase family protein [Spirochaetales bacterium]|nr:acetate--CoA ligase family protein [Spirochaetales bacterium]